MVVPESSINNIMGGLESTGGVRLHNHKRKLKQRFDIVKKLGQGTYGKVQLGINKETGQEVAIKTIKKCKIETEADLIRIRREIQIMSSVQHPNIIHIYEVFENREKMVLVMEYAAGGELYDFLSERKVLAEEEARRIFRQISTAVYYCHKHKICHRDLKLENILLDENGNAKIADFGLSNVFDESRLLGTFCGSPLYASPEIVKGTPYHGPEVDCWSLGVLLYTLVYGAMPFDGSNFKRLVRQISQGDYFEPKKPSAASSLIRDMLNVNPGRRADITAICSHWWIDQDQSERCMEVAEDLANQTPVRLDLLLCLAPSADADKLLVADQPPVPDGADRPMRSQSLSSLATAAAQPDFLPDSTSRRDPEPKSKVKEDGTSVKRKERSRSRRERSRSRSRRDDSTPEPEGVAEKPKRRSVKTKKNSNEKLVIEEPKEELLQPKLAEVEEELSKSAKTIRAPTTPVNEVLKEKSPVPSDVVVIEEIKPEDSTEPTTPVAEIPSLEPTAPSTPPIPSTPQAEPLPSRPDKTEEKPLEEEKPAKPMERRKSKIFETAEKFNKISTPEAQPKPQPKKMILAGVKVSDAKKAYERRSSLASSSSMIRGSASRKSLSGESSMSPPPADDTKFSLASSVALNKLVENVERLSKMEDEKEKENNVENFDTSVTVKRSPTKVLEVKKQQNVDETHHQDDEARKKVRNAVKVIGNALSDGGSKAATLPRRKTSRAEIKLAMPVSKLPEFRSEVEHMVGSPAIVQRSEVKFPVAAPSSAPRVNVRQGSTPKEYIVPIQFESQPTAVKPPPPPTMSQRPVSRTSSRSLSRQSTQDSDLGSSASVGEPIRKSPREVIIPIAVEGGGYVTPSADAISRMSSLNESGDDLPRGFGLHSSRRHNRQLETADSVSSDEDDDNFEILTAENLFSTLLSRVRSLTQRLNTEDRQTAFPRLFNHHPSIFDFPPRRLAEARSFGRADSVPWRRSMSRETSTLPRDGSVNRIGTPKQTGSWKCSGSDKPPLYRPSVANSSTDSLRNFQASTSSIPQVSEENEENLSSKTRNIHPTISEVPSQSSEKSLRGIPTSEIVGSTASKLLTQSKLDINKKTKLPRMSPKPVLDAKKVMKKELKDQENLGIKNMKPEETPVLQPNGKEYEQLLVTPNTLESGTSEPQPRRNSLERPSYYNSKNKNIVRSRDCSMSRSLALDQSQNGNLASDSSLCKKQEYIDQFDKLDTYLMKSEVDNGDISITDSDFLTTRPYSTLGRSYSLKGPTTKSYDSIRSPRRPILVNSGIEGKYNNGSISNSSISNQKGESRISSRFLRPKSFYGETDLTSYQTTSGLPTKVRNQNLDILSDRKSAFVGRRSPSYKRSISLFEGVKPETNSRSLSVTPDRSILGRFLPNKWVDNEGETAKNETIDKPSRRVSRFLRPDFYDTPKENSAYEKKETVKNGLNGKIWKEKDKSSTSLVKKHTKTSLSESSKNPDRLSMVDKAIKSLRENSVDREKRESMARESNLIKRAVSLEDCSLVPEHRSRRSLSLTPQTNLEKKLGCDKIDKMFQKKKTENYKKNEKPNLSNKTYSSKEDRDMNVHPKLESGMKRLSRKNSPKSVKRNGVLDYKKNYCNGFAQESTASEDLENLNLDVRSRLSRIAGLKQLEFIRPVPSTNSTPSMEDSKFVSADMDDSSSFLSPTEDGSDTWSVSSDYTDGKEFYPPLSAEETVSERIRRKSFYSRFNQSKRRKSQASQVSGSRSRLPMYSKSMSSDYVSNNFSKPIRKISDPDRPN